MRIRWLLLSVACLLGMGTADAQNKRDEAVRADKQAFSDDEVWFYDNLPVALEAAAKTKKPLMIVFR